MAPLFQVNTRLITPLIDSNTRVVTRLIVVISGVVDRLILVISGVVTRLIVVNTRVVTRLIQHNVAMGGGGYAITAARILRAITPSRFFNRVKGCYVDRWSGCMEYLIGGHPSNDEPFSVWYSELLSCQAYSPK
jgi:hypothetical protein